VDVRDCAVANREPNRIAEQIIPTKPDYARLPLVIFPSLATFHAWIPLL